MALAYLLGKPSAKALKVNLNIPLLMVLSIIPDIDLLLIPSMHRGPTHSAIVAIIVFIPLFVVYRKRALPYFLALISHSLIGDFFVGGQIQLFWPLTQEFGLHELGLTYIAIEDTANVAIELSLFLAATGIMIKTKDILQFFKVNKSNLILAIPIFTVLLPTFIGYPFDAPLLVTLPAEAAAHLFYLVLFAVSILIALNGIFKGRKIRHREGHLHP
jgi:membrane-bound metal-dependent hydrolase YbcI (DUF457 family)